MRVLVSGGAGFLGSHLCEALISRGDEVVCLDNLVTGSVSNVSHLESAPGFTYRRHNVSDPIVVDGVIDAVLHFASPASPPDYLNHPIHTLKVGTLGTMNMCGVARAKGARLLLASTSEIYGDPLVHPQPEEYWGNVNTVGPRGVYDEAKRCAEAIVMAYHREHSLETRIVRIFNTYGPRMRPNDGRAIPNFMSQALAGDELTVYGDGSQTRSLCYVSDLVRGILLLLASDETRPVNLGNPEEITMLELAERISRLAGRDSRVVFRPLPEDDPRQRRPDITRAREVLGWEPEVTLEQGVPPTLDWFRSAIPAAR